MAYTKIPQRFDDEWLFVADADADVATIAEDFPDAPDGSIVIADNSGSTAVHMKFPADWSKIGE